MLLLLPLLLILILLLLILLLLSLSLPLLLFLLFFYYCCFCCCFFFIFLILTMVRINFNQIILLACQQCKSPCIIAPDNGGSKAPIRLSGKGSSCLAQLLKLGCLGQTQRRRRFFSPIKLIPGNVVVVVIDMCGKSPITGEWIYGIT